MSRAGVWISRDERQVRNDARRHWSATGLISLDRSRSWIPPHRLFVHSNVFFAVSELVGEPTGGAAGRRLPAALTGQTPSSPALGRAAKPAAPRPGLAEQNRWYRTRLAGAVPTFTDVSSRSP
jgi:hypothetical protein